MPVHVTKRQNQVETTQSLALHFHLNGAIIKSCFLAVSRVWT